MHHRRVSARGRGPFCVLDGEGVVSGGFFGGGSEAWGLVGFELRWVVFGWFGSWEGLCEFSICRAGLVLVGDGGVPWKGGMGFGWWCWERVRELLRYLVLRRHLRSARMYV